MDFINEILNEAELYGKLASSFKSKRENKVKSNTSKKMELQSRIIHDS